MKKSIIKAASIGAFIGAVLAGGAMDYEDAVSAELNYCQGVSSGLWPAYNENINCSNVEKSNDRAK